MVRQSLVAVSVGVAALLLAHSAAGLEAGVGRADITPPLGSPLNGYGDRWGRGCLEVHDPLSARCLYLNDGQTGVFLVTSDLCLITPELRARVLELAPRGAVPQNVILTATHTHSAQGGMSKALVFRAVSGRFSPEVLEMTARGIAEAMRLAFETRRQAVIGYGKAEQTQGAAVSVNRRVDDGPIDPQIGVLRVNDMDLNTIAVLANFAAHPTTVSGSDMMSVSADYCGYFYDELEKRLPGVTAMFANGAEGNQRPAGVKGKSGWAATEAVGRELANRVAEAAATLNCGDAILHVGYSEPELPLSMAHFAPRKTILQTLEINDLLMAFVPGEPCVEIGLDLRARAAARGYAMQFTVGLSNDYAGYFVPPDYYAQNIYENSMNFYGPRIGAWLGREFNALMTLAKAEEPAGEVAAEVLETDGPVQLVVLKGTAYEIGRQRGKLYKDPIDRLYRARFVEPVETGELLPEESNWKKAPSFLDLSRYAMVVLGIGSRPLLQGAQLDLYEEVQGIADGVGLPFDAAWLAQALPTMGAREDNDAFFRTSFCTMLASTGDRAGASEILVARNLDWPEDGEDMTPIVFDVRPSGARRYMQVGFPWSAGVFTGMNENGVVVCAERMESLGQPQAAGLPIEFALRDILQSAKTADDAAVIIQQRYTHLRGYHVLIADAAGSAAYVLELGRTPVIRKPDKGFLPGANPDSQRIDEAAKARYARAAEMLKEDHVIGLPRFKEVLADQLPGDTSMNSIWNASTRYSVLFEPKKRAIHVSVPGEDGRPSEYVTLQFEGDV